MRIQARKVRSLAKVKRGSGSEPMAYTLRGQRSRGGFGSNALTRVILGRVLCLLPVTPAGVKGVVPLADQDDGRLASTQASEESAARARPRSAR